MRFEKYQTSGFYDEMFEESGRPRQGAAMLIRTIEALSTGEIEHCQRAAELALLNMGITFNVYGHEAGTEKIWPFDILPRIIEANEWEQIERGLDRPHERASRHRSPLRRHQRCPPGQPGAGRPVEAELEPRRRAERSALLARGRLDAQPAR